MMKKSIAELDRELTAEEREEWQAIYASQKSMSVMTGEVSGVDVHEFKIVPKGKRKAVPQTIRCLIVIKYRVKIIIPETEVFTAETEGGHVLHSMCGANVPFVVTHIEREAGFAIASRKLALEKMQKLTDRREGLTGRTVAVDVVSVGRNVCTVNFGGYDVMLAQRDVSYSLVPDLRTKLKPGDRKRAVIKEFNPEEKILTLSIKETTPHPFDGIEMRHPLHSTRIAKIIGKYGGGVFCRLYDDITDVLCSYESMQYDGDYRVGDTVEIVITKYNTDKKLVYGKVLRKMH